MPVRYRSTDEDSGRWEGFAFRQGDVVVSTRSKHGTTWLQTILLLLIHGPPPWSDPLGVLAPWLDHLGEPLERVRQRLAAQEHRRVIKTHTPLDGLPMDPRATHLVVARHPLDAAVSLYHQGDNIDRDRLAALTGTTAPAPRGPRRPPGAWLAGWVRRTADPRMQLDSLDGVLHHLGDAWARRDDPNVVLVHFDDLRGDLVGQMRRLADELELPPARPLAELAPEASFAAMRARADQLAPDASGILRDRRAFFRDGTSGAGAALLSAEDRDLYHRRVSRIADPGLLAWLHR